MTIITLATLKDATVEEVIRQAASHLLTQNKQSLASEVGDTCMYRMVDPEDGVTILKCGGGCFIGDDEYKPQFEGKVWSSLVNYHGVPSAHCELISSIQSVHDEFEPEYWQECLDSLAAKHGVTLSNE